MVTQGKCC